MPRNLCYIKACDLHEGMLTTVLYILAGMVLGGLLVHRWMQRSQRQAQPPSLSSGRILADAVLTACLWKLRKEDMVAAEDPAVLHGTRLPQPAADMSDFGQDALRYMHRYAAEVRPYLERQFPAPEDVEAFVLEVGAALDAALATREVHLSDTEETSADADAKRPSESPAARSPSPSDAPADAETTA